MNVIVLAAGRDDAFTSATQVYPKNLVEVAGEPLVSHALRAWRHVDLSRLVVCVNAEEDDRFHTGDVVRLVDPRAEVLAVPAQTGGALCTALLAMDKIEPDEPLTIVNGDIVLDVDLGPILADFARFDGGIVTFEAVHPRWSFVRTDAEGLVLEAAEKRPISRQATVGLYTFASARSFLRAASEHMVKAGTADKVFYVCPVYNEFVLEGSRITTAHILRNQYHSLADPRGVSAYEAALGQKGTAADADPQAL